MPAKLVEHNEKPYVNKTNTLIDQRVGETYSTSGWNNKRRKLSSAYLGVGVVLVV